jgi:hypothetical protein
LSTSKKAALVLRELATDGAAAAAASPAAR